MIRHGRIVAEWYFGGATRQSKFAAYSTSKWPNVPKDAFAALGKWDNNIFVASSLDLTVIRQSDLAPAKVHQIADYYQLVCDAVKKP